MATNKSIMTFADVFDLQMGKTPSRDISSYWSGDNVWVSIADMKDCKYVDSSKETISDEAIKATGIREVPEGTVFMSFKLSIGKVAIAAKNLYTNEAIMQFPIKPGYELSPEYLYYYLLGHKWQGANKAVMGATLNKKKIAQEHISFPSIEEQQRIVDELDLLTGIIDKKNAQLRDLDVLAQSIFYEMFGDPLTNEKGWPVRFLDEIASSQIGLTYKPENVSETGTIVLRSSNIQNSIIDLNDIVRVNCDIKEKQFVREGDILMCSRNGSFRLVGKVAKIQNLPERMSYGAFMTTIRSDYNDYLFGFFKTPAFRAHLGLAKTATINQITVKMLNAIQLPVPPKVIQSSFAERIAHISSQQNAIIESLKGIQHLFNSRMSLYFG